MANSKQLSDLLTTAVKLVNLALMIEPKNKIAGTNRLVVVAFAAQTRCMLEVITHHDATYVPYARRRPSGDHWEGAVDIVYLDRRTVHVCDRFHTNSADAVLDAAVDAMRLAGVF